MLEGRSLCFVMGQYVLWRKRSVMRPSLICAIEVTVIRWAMISNRGAVLHEGLMA